MSYQYFMLKKLCGNSKKLKYVVMKKLSISGLFLWIIGIILLGCTKNEMLQQNSMDKPISNGTISIKSGVVYANLSCDLPNGLTGCQCTITQSDDDCSVQTECVVQSSLPNYNNALESMFTYEQIQDRANNNVRITEPLLIKALKLDHFPLK